MTFRTFVNDCKGLQPVHAPTLTHLTRQTMAGLLPPERVGLLHQRWWFGPSGATAWEADDSHHLCHDTRGTRAALGGPDGAGASMPSRDDGAGVAAAADMHAGDPVSRPASTVLLCGEGDFSFASALVAAHHQRHHAHHVHGHDHISHTSDVGDATIHAASPTPLFVCTSLDTEEAVLLRYPAAAGNIEKILACGGVVLHEVDATKLTENAAVADAIGLSAGGIGNDAARCSALLAGRIVVIFQFPHHGGKGKIQVNRKLLRDFFSSAGALAERVDEAAGHSRGGRSPLSSSTWPSEVYVSLAPGQGGTEVDGKAQREWGNAWQVVCCAGDAGLVMRGAFRFDADAWTTLGYAPRGRNSRGLGEFHVDWAVTHVFAHEGIGIRGVCCPVWHHDVGLWCSPKREREDGDCRGDAAVPFFDGEEPAPFDEAAFQRFVTGHVGADVLANEPGQPAVTLVRNSVG